MSIDLCVSTTPSLSKPLFDLSPHNFPSARFIIVPMYTPILALVGKREN